MERTGKAVLPGRASDDEVGYMLWNETAFPMADREYVRLQLAQYKCTTELLCGGPYLTGEEALEKAGE